MRSPLLLLLLSLQIIHLAQSGFSKIPSWRLNWCSKFITRYGVCVAGSLLSRYPMCCYHPVFWRLNSKSCRWLQMFRRKKRTVGGCNPDEHVVIEVDSANNRGKRADFDSKLLDQSPDTSHGTFEVSDNSLWNVTEKSTNNLPSMFLETDVTTNNTTLDSPKYRSKRGNTPGLPVITTSLLDEVTDSSPKVVSVTCCGDSTTTTCGANTGKKCSTACGDQAVEAVDLVQSDDVRTCDPAITGGGTGRRRRKRGAKWSAATMASWKINWCPSRVSSNHGGNIWYYRICCFHPSVANHRYTFNLPEASDANEKTVGTFCHYKVSKVFKKTKMG